MTTNDVDHISWPQHTCEELDAIHATILPIAINTYKAVDRSAVYVRHLMVNFATELYDLLVREGLQCHYQPSEPSVDGVRQWISIGNTEALHYCYHIAVTVRLDYLTLIYLEDGPYLGTIRELLADIRVGVAKQATVDYCSTCYYYCKDVECCGQGLQLAYGCMQYKDCQEVP